MAKVTYVLAGNHQQFKNFVQDRPDRQDFKFLDDIYRLFGVKSSEIYIVRAGTAYLRMDYHNIINYAKSKNISIT